MKITRNKPKLHILVETYFQQRDYQRYGIDILLENGMDIEIWEIFRPFRPKYVNGYKPPDPYESPIIRKFADKLDIYNGIREMRPEDYVIAPLGWANSWRAAKLFRALASANVIFGSLVMRSVPVHRRFRFPTLEYIVNRLYTRTPHSMRRTKPWKFVLLCGGDALLEDAGSSQQTDSIWAHTLDYDLVLASGGPASGVRQDHIVFLDEYGPFHPDYLIMGASAPDHANEYYPKLCRFFSKIEMQLDLPVVIAAHPRSNYEKHPDYFEGRKVIRGDTCSLVRDAALVLTHCSMSNSFTAIYKKPAIVLTTDGLNKSYYGKHIESLAKTLGLPMINLDSYNIVDKVRVNDVCKLKYRNYVERLVKRTGTPEKNTWQIAADFFTRTEWRRR